MQPQPDRPLRSLHYLSDRGCVEIIDQTRLPFEEVWLELRELEHFCHAIQQMQVRGAPLIGITAAYGMAVALATDHSESAARHARDTLLRTRPTAVNLRWALDRMFDLVSNSGFCARSAELALELAHQMSEEDVTTCRNIGQHGLELLRDLATPGKPLQLMTHCNAGWLATLEWGTAMAPVYAAAREGLAVHVWVSETRPRNQGLNLTSWELARAGVAHTVIADNAAGYLMQQGQVDCVIVGSDRTVANGDVCNKVGTYLKALAARDNGVPFYVALPVSTIDFETPNGDGIPIEQRSGDELLRLSGREAGGGKQEIELGVRSVQVANPAFDVTPAGLVTGLITEQGVVSASQRGIASLDR